MIQGTSSSAGKSLLAICGGMQMLDDLTDAVVEHLDIDRIEGLVGGCV